MTGNMSSSWKSADENIFLNFMLNGMVHLLAVLQSQNWGCKEPKLLAGAGRIFGSGSVSETGVLYLSF
jgi:hypothetical protein